MASLGTLALGTFTNISNTAITGSDPVLELIASADDGDFVFDNSNTTHTGEASFALEDMPGDFATMDTLSIRLRYGKDAHSDINTWDDLRARVFKSDGTTPLTDEVTVVSGPIEVTTPTNSSVANFTGVDTAADETDWNGAVVRIYWGISRSKGGDSDEERVFAAEITGTYTLSDTGERYWVGGTADWDATAGTKWAQTSGGTGGAAVPTSAEDVFFDAASGAVTVTATTTVNCKGISTSGFTGTVTRTGGTINVNGDVVLGSGATHTWRLLFASGTNTITSNGKSIGFGGNISGGVWSLVDAFEVDNTNIFIHQGGTFDANDQNVSLAGGFRSSGDTARTLTMGSGTWTITGSEGGDFWEVSGTNATVNAETSVISHEETSGATRIFKGGGKTYATVNLNRTFASQTTVIQDSNTFGTLSYGSGTIQTVQWADGTTQTILTDFDPDGTSGNVNIQQTVSGGTANIVKTSGTIDINFVSLEDSAASGGATFNAFTSDGNVDNGGNSGWNFSVVITLEADAGAYAITGTTAALKKDSLLSASAGAYALSGVDATLSISLILVTDAGAYALTGASASLVKDRLLAADAGDYAIDGIAADLTRTRIFTVDAGSYAITGSAADLLKTLTLIADAGSYNISGSTAALIKALKLIADAGSYALSGQDASLAIAIVLPADAGAYAISGADAALLKALIIDAAAGSYGITGAEASLIVSILMEADAGVYSLDGQATDLRRALIAQADAGAYLISGLDATLTEGGGAPAEVQKMRVYKFVNLNRGLIR